MTWDKLQIWAAENKWGLAVLCMAKSELMLWDETDSGVHVVLKAPVRTFCEPKVVAKLQDRLSAYAQKPVQVTMIVESDPIPAL